MEQLLSDYYIVCLQETWLAKQKEQELKAMRKDFNAVWNGMEGVAILWNNKFYKFITPHKYDYDWVVSIEIVLIPRKCMYLMFIYLMTKL